MNSLVVVRKLQCLFPLLVVFLVVLEQQGQHSMINAFVIPSSHYYSKSVTTKNDLLLSLSRRTNKNEQTSKSKSALSAFWDKNKEEEEEKKSEVAAIIVPPSVSPMAVVRRSLPLYVALLGLNVLTFLPLGDLVTTNFASPTMSAEESRALASAFLNNARTVFFGLTAVLTAYLGAERQDVGQTQAPVTQKSAIFAPLFAGGILFVLYLVIQYTQLNPGLLYRVFTSFFGWICLTELLQPIVALSPLGVFLAQQMVQSSSSDDTSIEQEDDAATAASNGMYFAPPEGETQSDILTLRACGLPAAAVSASVVVAYWLGVTNTDGMASSVSTLRQVAFTNNYIAGSIGLVTLGQIAIESYVAGSALLSGLFLYDALSVFKSDAMVTVATKIEAPVKLLFAGNSVPTLGKYPFAVLGLGDIVIPGVFLAMLRQFDIEQWYNNNESTTTTTTTAGKKKKKANKKTTNKKKDDDDKESMLLTLSSPREPSSDLYSSVDTPYFTSGLVFYVVGLGLTFLVLTLTGQGQPALFYIVPSLILGSSGTALVRGEVSELWSYKGARAAAATVAREDAMEEDRKQKEEKEKKKKQNS